MDGGTHVLLESFYVLLCALEKLDHQSHGIYLEV